jgi:hypothetical protein
MSQDAYTLIDQQRQLEKLYNKNQTLSRIRSEFISEKGYLEHMENVGIDPKFGFNLLAQMVLHKRCDLPTLVGVLNKMYDDVQQTTDMILLCAEYDLVDWNPALKVFIHRFGISDDVQEDLDRYQYPLPMVVRPKKVNNNSQNGYLTSSKSIILKDNHHDDDVCLGHINHCNSVELSFNHDVIAMVKNQWRNLDKPKEGESKQDFEKRKRAFEKYDRTAHDVIAVISEHTDVFHLTHSYDKRGRSYAQGYHVNYQGAPWNKATINFANQEVTQ